MEKLLKPVNNERNESQDLIYAYEVAYGPSGCPTYNPCPYYSVPV